MTTAKPKYQIITDDLETKILSGHFPPGSELPSESELIEQYKVSRITIRRAIDELCLKNYLDKKQGKRACVRVRTKYQNLNGILSYTEEITKYNMTPSRKVIASQLRLCNQDEIAAMHLDKIDPIFSLQRIIYADKIPLCYTDSKINYKFFKDIEYYDFSKHSLYEIIEHQYQIKILFAELKLKAILPDKNIAEYLEKDKSTPLLLSTAITYGLVNESPVAIEYFKTYYLTDRFEYTLSQKR